MAIRRDDPASRPAQSFYEVVERFDGFAAVRIAAAHGAARIRFAFILRASAARCCATGNTAAGPGSRAASFVADPADDRAAARAAGPARLALAAHASARRASRSTSRPRCRPISSACWQRCANFARL